MQVVRALHRWTGGFIGLLLAVLGLSGSLLVWRDAWLRFSVEGASNTLSTHLATAESADALGRIGADNAAAPSYIVFPSDTVGIYGVNLGGGQGYYADRAGAMTESWAALSDRLELWLFDLHHHLLFGETGEVISGIAGLVGLAFVVTGTILWWRARRQFNFRLWPRSLRRNDIIRHHRDAGVIAAPLLVIVMLTGIMMIFRPVATVLLSPLSAPGEIIAALSPPVYESGGERFDHQMINWQKVLTAAKDTFPEGDVRLAIFPRGDGPLSLRIKLPSEWLPNGRTLMWFDPVTSELIEARSAETHPLGLKVYNMLYPLHSAKVGGLLYQLALTLVGLVLALLGTLAVWSFWRFEIKKPRVRKKTSG